MSAPITLVVDIGGTSIKASSFDADARPIGADVRVPTQYPLTPEGLVERLAEVAAGLPGADRVSVGFPGVLRAGRVRTAPEFVAVAGLGTAVVGDLVRAWTGFDLAGEVARRLSLPTRVANDADLLGLGVVEGTGVELAVTLGAGFGTALLVDGALGPHLELAHHPLRDGDTYNEQLGDAARQEVGSERWTRRVERALDALQTLTTYDRAWVLGGNTRWLTRGLEPRATVADDRLGRRGGVRLWDGRDGTA